ncbi:MAG: endonuclease domain-containing protein [Cyanobacteria bacterium J06627_32]
MEEHIVHYNPKLKARASQLRNRMTQGEIILWQRLKQSQMMGYDFDRQKPIDQFIVDFYCKALALAIEVDGPIHDSKAAKAYDAERQARLEGLGIRFLRFSDNEVRTHPNTVCQKIAHWIVQNRSSGTPPTTPQPPSSPSPSQPPSSPRPK